MRFNRPIALRPSWSRSSRLSRMTVITAAVDVLLIGGSSLMGGSIASALAGWTVFVTAILIVLLLCLWVRWVRRVVMWRLRNRLIVTYMFIGVIPVVLLITMFALAGWLFSAQFASYIVASDLRAELKSLDAVNNTLASFVVEQLDAGVPAQQVLSAAYAEPLHADTNYTITLENNQQKLLRTVPGGAAVTVNESVAKVMENAKLVALAHEDRTLYVRAVRRAQSGTYRITVVSSTPIRRSFVERLAADLGIVSISGPDFLAAGNPEPRNEGFRVAVTEPGAERNNALVIGNSSTASDGAQVPMLPAIKAGKLPPSQGRWDRGINFFGTVDVIDWPSGRTAAAPVPINTRISVLQARISKFIGPIVASFVIISLIAVAAAFAIIELVALIVGIRLTRTVTRSVHELYEATQQINAGNFDHRIQIRSTDQLAALETSFNSMTSSLQRLLEEQKEKQRMESELAIAHEVQSQLFPRHIVPMDTIEVFGMCRPARTVSGDYYDFLPLGPERMGIAVGDISGKGISAALLMATVHSAVRVYEFGRSPSREQLIAAGAAAVSAASSGRTTISGVGHSPAEVMCLLNRHLYHSTPPEKYATMFLGVWDGSARRMTYCNAGHLPPIVLCADGSVQKLASGGTVVGLFDECEYEQDSAQIRPGDLFVAYSDGVTEPENEFGEFGEARLIELLHANRDLPLDKLAGVVGDALKDWIGSSEQPDDVTLVFARAK